MNIAPARDVRASFAEFASRFICITLAKATKRAAAVKVLPSATPSENIASIKDVDDGDKLLSFTQPAKFVLEVIPGPQLLHSA